MGETLQGYFLRVFDLKKRELKKVLLLQLYIFILITTLLIVKPTVSSIFLSELTSDALPLAYVLTAALAVLFSMVYNRILSSFSLKKVIIGTFVFCIGALLLFSFLLNQHPGLVWWLYIPYLFVAIYGLLTTSQFWILSNMVFNVREAKRIFGFIGSGAIAGGIFGGYLTSFLSRFISSENLLVVAAALLLICVPISIYLWNKYVHESKVVGKKQEKESDNPFALIKRNQLLSWLTMIVAVSVMVAKLVDYQYSHFAAEKITNKEALTAFFGFWFSTLSVVSLLIQLFLSKRIIAFFGVGNALAFLPVGILLGSILLLFIPELWVVVLIKIADGSFKQSLNKVASELLILPVPLEVKKRAKTFIDVVVDSIATGIAGIVLIFLINGLKVPSVSISYINIGLIVIWLFLISRVFRSYIEAFRNLLITEHPKAKKHEVHHIDTSLQSVYAAVDHVLREGNESQVIHMLEEILHNPDEHYFSALKNLLDHPSAHVRALAIENLYYLVTEDLSAQMKGMLNDPDNQVVIDAIRYLLHKNHDLHHEDILSYEQASNHTNIKALTLLAISMEVHTDEHLKELVNLPRRVDDILALETKAHLDEEHVFNICAAIEAIGHTHLASHYPVIQEHLRDDHPEIVIAALDSAAQVRSKNLLPEIIRKLPKKQFRQKAIETLHAYGESVIPNLVMLVNAHAVSLDSSLFVPRVIEGFASPAAVSTLILLIDTGEYSVSVQAIESLKRLKTEKPDLKINKQLIIQKILDECRVYQDMLSFLHAQVKLHNDHDKTDQEGRIQEARKGLIAILEHRLDGQLERIFKLLGIRYHDEDVDPVLQVILSGTEEDRINAIEFIDNIIENNLKGVLLPIIDNARSGQVYSEELIERLRVPTDMDEEKCFDLLMKRHDIKIRHGVLYLIEQLDDRKYLPMVRELTTDYIPSVSDQARRVLEKLEGE